VNVEIWGFGLKFIYLEENQSATHSTAIPTKVETFEGQKILALTTGTNFVSVFTGYFLYVLKQI
jgi:hypothetical protein